MKALSPGSANQGVPPRAIWLSIHSQHYAGHMTLHSPVSHGFAPLVEIQPMNGGGLTSRRAMMTDRQPHSRMVHRA
ncbi:hypothetical protein LMG27952_01916 [Paraburkholderia hiiakae]|uniref:Uncharacterized protein n=1 Tax=Paraburkholderia hiiakae TaxID=1081782 RepID=A0ABM8NHQ3_9BURK|nr:hypothetical protein LMG27952_01916 [Paraburkholderia hiiakae]